MPKKTQNFTGLVLISLTAAFFFSCGKDKAKDLNITSVVTTTTHLADVLRQVGGSNIRVISLMGPGVDPHLYKASEGDVSRLTNADAIIYHGLHLEGKMAGILESLSGSRSHIYSAQQCLEGNQLLESADYPGNHDPHVWFDIGLWQQVITCSSNWLSAMLPEHEQEFKSNAKKYNLQLDSLFKAVKEEVTKIEERKRILITAHDAFAYFGKSFGIKVRGLLGLSTADEAGARDIQELADFIVTNQIPAIFVESSIPTRYLEALQEAVASRDFKVVIGGELYSDALGSQGDPEATYIGMYRHNVNTIVSALSGKPGAEK